MPRISIAMSGGPNPAESIDLVVLAERLGYESAWVAEGGMFQRCWSAILSGCMRCRATPKPTE
jgi:alkanesulfonate monooxygenase SsuD/methylene tetrahydromethanopterin reductase-like flavin-dependent oxidoreductase (luciferase family)